MQSTTNNSTNNPTSIILSKMKDMPPFLRLPDIVDGGSTVIEVLAFQCQCWIKEVIIPEGYTKINRGAFRRCFYLRKITLPSTLTHIGDEAFHECLRLENINLGHVKHIGEKSFSGKSIPNNRYRNALRKLQSIDLTSIETIGERAFAYCTSGNNFLDLPNVRTIGKEAFMRAWINRGVKCGEHLKSIGGGAFSCSTIASMNLADCKNLTTMGVSAFGHCRWLSRFVFSRENKLKQLRNKVFLGCGRLKEIDLPEGLTKIGNWCFESCFSLERVAWPASLQRVGEHAFEDCLELEKPSESVSWRWTSIGEDAFLHCKEPPPPLFDNPNVFVEISADELNSDICGICLDSFMTGPTCQLSCKHLFHQHCACEWYKRNQTCSKCRQPVTSVAIVLPNKKRPVSVSNEQTATKRQRLNVL
jgi:hypothetical protein